MEWGGNPSESVCELKRRFVEEPIWVATDYTLLLHVESDASDFVLQEPYYQCSVEDEKWHPCPISNPQVYMTI